jgi:hypothetical protein
MKLCKTEIISMFQSPLCGACCCFCCCGWWTCDWAASAPSDGKNTRTDVKKWCVMVWRGLAIKRRASRTTHEIYINSRDKMVRRIYTRKKSFLLVSVVAGVKRKRTYTACWGWQKKCVVAVATLTHSLTLSLLWMSPSHSLSVISFPELHPRSLSPTRDIKFISH